MGIEIPTLAQKPKMTIIMVRNHDAKEPFALIYDPEAAQHLKAIGRKHHSLIRRTIEEQFHYELEVETRNHKPLLRPSVFGTA